MDKKAYLEEAYESALQYELEKIAKDDERMSIPKAYLEDVKHTDLKALKYGLASAVPAALISKAIPYGTRVGDALKVLGAGAHIGLGGLSDMKYTPSRALMKMRIGPKALGAAMLALAAGGMYGSLKGGQDLIEKHTGEDVSKKRALAIGAERAAIETVSSAAGKAAGRGVGNVLESATGIPYVSDVTSLLGNIGASIIGGGWASRRALENKGFVKVKKENKEN